MPPLSDQWWGEFLYHWSATSGHSGKPVFPPIFTPSLVWLKFTHCVRFGMVSGPIWKHSLILTTLRYDQFAKCKQKRMIKYFGFFLSPALCMSTGWPLLACWSGANCAFYPHLSDTAPISDWCNRWRQGSGGAGGLNKSLKSLISKNTVMFQRWAIL